MKMEDCIRRLAMQRRDETCNAKTGLRSRENTQCTGTTPPPHHQMDPVRTMALFFTLLLFLFLLILDILHPTLHEPLHPSMCSVDTQPCPCERRCRRCDGKVVRRGRRGTKRVLRVVRFAVCVRSTFREADDVERRGDGDGERGTGGALTDADARARNRSNASCRFHLWISSPPSNFSMTSSTSGLSLLRFTFLLALSRTFATLERGFKTARDEGIVSKKSSWRWLGRWKQREKVGQGGFRRTHGTRRACC